MKTIGWIATAVVAAVVAYSLAFGMTWMGLKWRGFFGPRFAAVEREVFMQTRSYNQGMIQQLARYHVQYIDEENEVAKAAIRNTVRTMFSEYNPESIPNEILRDFHKECFTQ
jgi:hypothetical protein